MKDENVMHDRVEEFDEYLWPLTDAAWPVNWTRLAEEHAVRQRLDEIMAHVRETHVAPRLRRLGDRPNPTAVLAATQAVIVGPTDGPCWEIALREPVPRVLRDEWQTLSARLRAIAQASRAPRPGRRD